MDQSVSSNKDETPGCSKGNDPSKDKLFDPSIDMLINDFDDERTLEEEEALAAGEANDPSAELSNLERESNMPLDELLALYGYNTKENESSSESEEEEESPEQAQIYEPLVAKERSPTPPRQSKLSLLYEPMAEDIDDSRNLTSVSRISDDEEEDAESIAEEEDLKYIPGKHTIMVGSDYQAQIPENTSTTYDQIPANDNEDQLLWNPQAVYSQQVEEYLRKAHEITKPVVEASAISKEAPLRDDEEALCILKECGYNIEDALRKLEMKGPSAPRIPNGNETKWAEEESHNFESGMHNPRKDFLLIQKNNVTD